jgi:hypothetical protein
MSMFTRRFILGAIGCFVCPVICGCMTDSSARMSAPPTIGAVALTTTPAASNRVCVRVATPPDLEAILFTRPGSSDHFPVCTLKLYNKASEPVIVGYTPNCVTIHCGSYEQQGPGVTFVHRREILEPQNALELEIPAGNWTMNDAGERQLMLPTTLPAGTYQTWAVFKVEGDTPTEITSKRAVFVPP